MSTDDPCNQYPHVRALGICLSCGNDKGVGLLVCWDCHNNLKLHYDGGYGPVMDNIIARADKIAISASIMASSRHCDE